MTKKTVLAFLALGVVASFALAAEPDEKPAAATPPPRRPLLTISTETTRITEPLRADGYVDYITALNQHFSQGVTPDNNAAVLMIKAMGPGVIPKEIREQYVKMLGISPLPEEGPYFVAFGTYAERAQKAATPGKQPSNEDSQKSWDDLTRAMDRPWSKVELPLAAAWLEVNERSLAMIVEATRRPRRYDPLLATGYPPVMCTLLPMVQAHRDAARALAARAMLRLGAGRIEEAWQDTLACHRLSRLTSQGGTIIELLVAIAIDGITCRAERAILAQANLTAAQARQTYDDLGRLPPLPKMANAIDLGERYMFLDCVQMLADRGLAQLGSMVGGRPEDSSALGGLLSAAGAVVIDWDVILRMGNSWYDRFVAAQRKPTRAERLAAMNELDGEIRKLAANAKDLKSLAWSMLGGPGRAVSERIGQILIALLMPALNAATEAEERGAEDFEVVRLGFLLAAYRAENGKYPAELTDLTPKYIASVPLDPFSGRRLIYKRQAGGYVLYSVGVNGKDDGGLGYDDRGQALSPGQDYDDLVVQVPLKNRERRPK
jgi:hypothetical protein